jgi:GNAT superfamily N-acetyltransferase
MVAVRAAGPGDVAALSELYARSWGGPVVVGHGTAYDLTALPTLVADDNGQLAGALTYHVSGVNLEVVSLDADPPCLGTGTALLAAAIEVARAAGKHRLWLITTNDNVDALRFYQRRGLRIVGVSPGAVDRSRAIKPGIPQIGAYGIPIHDEIVLELLPLIAPGEQFGR